MALDGCGQVCKYILFIFNLIFAVVGFAFLGLGLWRRFRNTEFQQHHFQTDVAVTVLITLGVVMLIVVALGAYGACSEKRCALQVFSALLAILALAEVVVGILAYSSKDKIKVIGDFNALLVMGIFVGTGVLLITALVCTIILLKKIKSNSRPSKRGRLEVTTQVSVY